ncbi:NADP-dependent oxidoreductase [Nocardia pseudobrasiliensis]|uniref:Enoyl reductase (ER) domain-containing protein n=1 Tax=Nocardia pseudobrasiliensis TaxID=45979 RepID=A0A370IC03_9NOCA|nr:NADP-dependent oxidoreductase [Nocardia pseudobrasiliensis]RDI66934.1 hypothetical protein DFR76_1035 [Nocardia pseudobrasiliensis]
MTEQSMATEIRLAARPNGIPTLDDFQIADTEIPTPGAGQVLVRNLVMSVDPTTLRRIRGDKSYARPVAVGEVLDGPAAGTVVTSTVDDFKPGDHVVHALGWRTHSVVDAQQTAHVDTSVAPLSAYLGVLGQSGLTAYAGLLETAEFTPGDTVFVSAAAGSVGSVVGQLAKLKGAKRVVGSAGSAEKVRYLTEQLGFDAAFNYKDSPIAEQLRAAAPDGIDIYFDNVGGEQLEAAIEAITVHGRITVCGRIAQYSDTGATTPGPNNFDQIIAKRFTLRGLLVSDHYGLREQFLAEVVPLVEAGRLKYSETVVEGIRNAPQALLGLLSGANTGKMLVHIAD